MRVFLGIGSNLNRRRHIQGAIDALRRQFGAVVLSPVYRSVAMGFEGPDFFNLVAMIETDLPIDTLLAQLKTIEREEGRRSDGKRFASRTLDIDILLYGKENLRSQGYDVPRAEILDYAFVLKPLSDLAPDVRHPETDDVLSVMWQQFKRNDDRSRLFDADWTPE